MEIDIPADGFGGWFFFYATMTLLPVLGAILGFALNWGRPSEPLPDPLASIMHGRISGVIHEKYDLGFVAIPLLSIIALTGLAGMCSCFVAHRLSFDGNTLLLREKLFSSERRPNELDVRRLSRIALHYTRGRYGSKTLSGLAIGTSAEKVVVGTTLSEEELRAIGGMIADYRDRLRAKLR